jgi:hypothetical protein
MAEPDYGGLIEYPDSMGCGRAIAEGLSREGADPCVGRKLPAIFRAAGLQAEAGLASGLWDSAKLEFDLEAHRWLLKDVVGENEFVKIQSAQDEALRQDTVVFFLPVFWACGIKE